MLIHLQGLFDCEEQFEDNRLPEFFCGFDREANQVVPYPVACSPQAWAAGTPFACIQALLGIHVDGFNKKITFISLGRTLGNIKFEVLKNTTDYAITLKYKG